jgi:pyridinium-3,5-bisthiocarboxylic acid mononucleotide nickel chelatase
MDQYQATQLITISTCIDDLSPEYYPYVLDQLFKIGVNDAWIEPIIMKKGRPGIKLEVLCAEEKKLAVSEVIFKETSSIGLKVSHVQRIELKRKEFKIEFDRYKIRVKVSFLSDGSISTIKPEASDCQEVASALNLPLKEVSQSTISKALEKVQS